MRRLYLVIGVSVYLALIQWFYIAVIADFQGDFGYPYTAPEFTDWLLSLILAMLPAAWMPTEFRRPSQLLYLFVYLTVFIPCSFVPLFAADPGVSPSSLNWLSTMLLVCMVLWGLSYLVPPARVPRAMVHPREFWGAFWTATVVGVALCLGVFTKMGFSSLLSPHEQRGVFMEALKGSSRPSLVGYVVLFLPRVVSPFLVAVGLWKRRWSLLAVGLAIDALMYAITAYREIVVSIVLMFGLSWVLRGRKQVAGVALAYGLTFLLALCSVGYKMSSTDDARSFWMMIPWRLIIIPARLTGHYFVFFNREGFTYFSQVKGVNLFVTDRYGGRPLADVVGDFMGGLGANANFWADGYAGGGAIGLLLVTGLMVLTCYAIDSLLLEKELPLVLLVLSHFAIPVANTPIYTVLLGGGLGLTILMNYLAPSDLAEGGAGGVPGVPRDGGGRIPAHL